MSNQPSTHGKYGPLALCHPDKKHVAKGLCRTCYRRHWRNNSPGQKKKESEYQKKWKERNREHANAYRREWVAKNPEYEERRKANQRRRYKDEPERRWHATLKKFGLVPEQYEELLSSQGFVCAICLKQDPLGRRLAVDHCHTTGKIRGLLCSLCNTAIGMLKDDTTSLLRAVSYLEKHK